MSPTTRRLRVFDAATAATARTVGWLQSVFVVCVCAVLVWRRWAGCESGYQRVRVMSVFTDSMRALA
jgi:hypothetical protein